MNTFRTHLLLVCITLGTVLTTYAQPIITELTCEYLTQPLCISTDNPRLGWKLSGTNQETANQVAFRILVASSPEKLAPRSADLWDSGRTESSSSSQIVYQGRTPQDIKQYFWKVGIWTEDSEEPIWSSHASWEKMTAKWDNAYWIGDTTDVHLRDYLFYVADHHSDTDFDYERWRNPPVLPSPLLRKTFTIPEGNSIRNARLYASALGYYTVMINGERVSDNSLAPEWTDYDRNVQFQTYDVTSLLHHTGLNVISAILADGWALGRLAGVKWMRSFPHRGHYTPDRRFIAILDIEYDNGERTIIPTDDTWLINRDGYILCADNFAGQTIDARKIPHGWNTSNYDDSQWAHAKVDTTISRVLTPQPNEPIKVHTTLSPKTIWTHSNGNQFIDFGQNIAGHCALKIKGQPGQKIIVRHGEWLEADSTLYTRSLGYALATDTFYLSGNEDYFEPDLTYHGFQFVEIAGLTEPLKPEHIVAKAISSAASATGSFACSNEDLNQLYRNIVWTQRNNMLSVITDNPSRDERTGALGDIQIFCQASIFNIDMASFYTKMLGDIQATAHNGQFFSMVPSLKSASWNGWIGAPGWCEAGLIVPWRMYVNYGDRQALERLYPQMKTHIDTTLAENPDFVWRNRHNHNGDWLNANTISADIDSTYSTSRGAMPDDTFATAFLAYSTRLLADIADVLGEKEDFEKYSLLADSVKSTFINNYIDNNGKISGDCQGAYSLALYYDLVPDNLREKAFGNLLRCIEEYDYRLSTGFITTPMMMQTLTDFGRSDIAYRLLLSKRFPSWLNIVSLGATTVWERWDAWSPKSGFQNPTMNSLDHVALGAVSEWMFRNILGINPDESQHPGFKHFILHPRPGGDLKWARGSYNSINGRIDSAWKQTDDGYTYTFTIPNNTTATVILPASSKSVPDAHPSINFEHTGGNEVKGIVGPGTYKVKIR